MTLVDILKVSGYIAGGLVVGFTGLAGVIQCRNNYDCAMQLYKDLPEAAKDVVGKPNRTKIYLQSLIETPKCIYCATLNKPFDGAFMNYVKPLEKKYGEGYMQLLILSTLLRG